MAIDARDLITVGNRPRWIRHEVRSTAWSGPSLRIAVLSDPHPCWPWTPLSALGRAVAMVNAAKPDLVLLPGDFVAGRKLPARAVPIAPVAEVLAQLTAPLGRFAVLGNHDWDDGGGYSIAAALNDVGVPCLMNEGLLLQHHGTPLWLAGLESQVGSGTTALPDNRHDLLRALRGAPDGTPTLLLAHEPDVFVAPANTALLQISGHTHGGQLNLFGWRPLTPSIHGQRFAHGLVEEGGRHLVTSGGLGYSGLPLRIGVPPELTFITLSGGL